MIVNSNTQQDRKEISEFDRQFWQRRQENIKEYGESHIWLRKRGEEAFMGQAKKND